MSISRDALKAAADAPLPRETVHVPELGGTVTLQGMGGRQRDAWERSLVVGKGRRRDVNTDNIRARLVCQCALADDGSRLLTDEDAEWLGKLRVDVLNRLYSAAQKLCGVTDEDVEELKKSFGTAAGTDSPSA